jgi:hypothetical protein
LQSVVCSWRPGRTVSVLVALLALACHTPKMPAVGRLVVATLEAAPAGSTAKATFVGSLELRDVRDGALSSIPIQGLAPGSVLRRELPAGLYVMTWTSDAAGSGRMVRELPLVGILAGQVTTLLVRQPEACSLSPRAALVSDPPELRESPGLAFLDSASHAVLAATR